MAIGRYDLMICYLYNTKGIAAFGVAPRKLQRAPAMSQVGRPASPATL
jgi:hypothetical protein